MVENVNLVNAFISFRKDFKRLKKAGKYASIKKKQEFFPHGFS